MDRVVMMLGADAFITIQRARGDAASQVDDYAVL